MNIHYINFKMQCPSDTTALHLTYPPTHLGHFIVCHTSNNWFSTALTSFPLNMIYDSTTGRVYLVSPQLWTEIQAHTFRFIFMKTADQCLICHLPWVPLISSFLKFIFITEHLPNLLPKLLCVHVAPPNTWNLLLCNQSANLL